MDTRIEFNEDTGVNVGPYSRQDGTRHELIHSPYAAGVARNRTTRVLFFRFEMAGRLIDVNNGI